MTATPFTTDIAEQVTAAWTVAWRHLAWTCRQFTLGRTSEARVLGAWHSFRLAQFTRDLATIKAMGAKVNYSCGLHIHIGFDHNDAQAKARLITLVANFEKAIFASTGTKKRENSRWCNRISRFGTPQHVVENRDRYHVLNINTHKPTVEFRAFSGSTNRSKIVGYLRMCMGIVERAIRTKKITDWTAKTPVETSPISRGGEGQTALNRLFYQLGWTKGRQSHTHGDLQAPGTPSIKTTKKVMMGLAKKYDAQA